MGGISNTLRQRLAARPAPQVHPEADMLTAYLEQALPAPEREQIALHLASCADCREVAALSLPMQPDLQQARALPVGRGLWWVGLRWAGLAATIVIVAALAIKQPWRESNSNKFVDAKPVISNTPLATDSAQPPATVATQDQPVAGENKTASPGLAAASSAAPPPERREASALDTKKSYVKVDRFATASSDLERDADDARALPPTPAPQSGSGVNLQSVFATGSLSRNVAPPDLMADLKAGDPGAGLQSRASSAAGKSRFVSRLHLFPKVGKRIIAPVFSTGSLSGKTMGGDGAYSLSLPRTDSTASATLARPMTSPEKDKVAATSMDVADGPSSLKESAAFTEKARAPAPASGAGEAYLYRAEAAGVVQWKVAEGKLLKSTASFDWQEAYPLHNVAFTTVTHHGNEIWAGGAHAALVHSRNNGTDWEKVNIGDAATGDIARITIEGAKITVKTSTQQTWSSQDGGRSWTLQTSSN